MSKAPLREATRQDLSKTNVESLNEREATRYKIYSVITEQLSKCKTMEELKEALKRKDIKTVYKYKGETSEKQGVSFSLEEYKLKGSEVDRNHSLNGLQKQFVQVISREVAISRNQNATMVEKALSGSSRASARERYLTMKQTSLLNTLLKPEEQSEMQAQSLLPKKQKKKKKGKIL